MKIKLRQRRVMFLRTGEGGQLCHQRDDRWGTGGLKANSILGKGNSLLRGAYLAY